MAEYIEREKAKFQIYREFITEKDTSVRAFKALNTVPSTADVQPVIYCKDCYAYRKDKELARAAYLDEDYYCALLRTEMPPDGFCYYGRRRNDDG